MCKVLECETSELLPARSSGYGDGGGQSPTYFEFSPDGTTARIRLDRTIPSKIAVKIIALLTEAT
jgi:hypothetical protein